MERLVEYCVELESILKKKKKNNNNSLVHSLISQSDTVDYVIIHVIARVWISTAIEYTFSE